MATTYYAKCYYTVHDDRTGQDVSPSVATVYANYAGSTFPATTVRTTVPLAGTSVGSHVQLVFSTKYSGTGDSTISSGYSFSHFEVKVRDRYNKVELASKTLSNDPTYALGSGEVWDVTTIFSDNKATGSSPALCVEVILHVRSATPKFTVSYETGGGTPVPDSIQVESGTRIILASAPSLAGSTFVGWLANGSGASLTPGSSYPVTADVRFVAKWTTKSVYQVKFDKNNASATGENSLDTLVEEGSSITVPGRGLYALSGYVFAGWSTSSGGQVEYVEGDTLTPTGNLTLYAIWRPEGAVTGARVSKDESNGPTSSGSKSVTNSIGYRMVLSTNVDKSISVQYVNRLTGSFRTNTKTRHEIKTQSGWVLNTGEWGEDAEKTTYGEPTASGPEYRLTATVPATTSVPNAVMVTIPGDLALQDEVTVSINASSDRRVKTTESTFGSTNYSDDWEWSAPDIDGYTFLGWFTLGQSYSYYRTDLTDDLFTVLISRENRVTFGKLRHSANYTTRISGSTSDYYNQIRLRYVKNPTVTFNPNGGAGGPSPITVKYGEKWTCPTDVPTRQGYTCKGWSGTLPAEFPPQYIAGMSYGPAYTDLLVYAVWVENQGTLIYNATGGTVTPSYKVVPVGCAYGTLPTPKLTGATFLGWYTAVSGGTKVSSTTVMGPEGVAIIYAHWETGCVTTTVNVALNANGGTLATSYVIATGSYPTLPNPTRPGYSFAGWFSTPFGNVQIRAGDSIIFDEDHEIYARWNRGKSVITFDANGGTCGQATKEVSIGTAAGRLPTASMDGKNFDGWYTDRENGEKVSASTVITSSLTVYAHYSTFKTTPWVTITISD